MQALVFDKSKYSWENSKGFEKVGVPEPVLDEKNNPSDRKSVVIKVHYAGVCGTDRGIWYRQAFKDQILESLKAEGKAARILGHEFAGEIVAAGSAAEEFYQIKKDDFVSCESHVVCNECYQCVRGQKNVCANEKILGISHDGGFAEYVKVPGHIVWKTDKTKIRPEIAAIQEPFGNAVHAASKVDLKGKTVAIFGLGPIGLFTVLVAQGRGAKTIIGIEPNPVTRKMAEKLGLEHLIVPAPDDGSHHHDREAIEKIMDLTTGVGVDVGLEMSGFNSSLNNVIAATRRGGEVILFGLKNGDFVLEDYNKLIVKGQTFHAVIGRQIWQTWETTRKLLEDPAAKIQEKIFNTILNQGQGTILSFSEYTPERFEKMMIEHPKFLLQF